LLCKRHCQGQKLSSPGAQPGRVHLPRGFAGCEIKSASHLQWHPGLHVALHSCSVLPPQGIPEGFIGAGQEWRLRPSSPGGSPGCFQPVERVGSLMEQVVGVIPPSSSLLAKQVLLLPKGQHLGGTGPP